MKNLAYRGATVVLSLSLAACGDDGIASTETASTGSTGQETTTGKPTTDPTTDPTTPTSTTTPTTEPTTDPTTPGTATTMVDTDPTPGTTVETEGDTTTGTTDGTTGDTDDTSTSTTDMMGVCGDGAIDAGEECDDGPDNGDMASCHSDCKLDVCGDALVGPAEGCDDGPDNGDMNACKADCTPAMCGDGLKGPGEGCDDGNADDADACTNACALATCGDSVVSVSEECDDGNQEDTDLCTNACTEAECGDLIVQPVAGEACDNGFENGDAGDCTATCNLAACGDGLIHNEGMGIEQCDNGGENGPGKACNAECLLNVCGDGDLGPGEGCDDGNLVAGDGCNASCVLEVCGNAVKDAGEACDDGKNGNQDDGCTDQCTTPICGDSFVQASLGETCDLGGQNSNTGACTLACKTAVCGDALVQAGVEQCDEGANNGNSKACKADCSDNVCGDGFVEVGVEDCDDANAIDNDACSNVCKAAACNDGVKNGQETDVDCGGPTCGLCPTVILLAGGNTGPNGHVGATFTNALGWTTTPLAGVTVTDLDLTMTSANVGVGVLRYTKIGDPLDNRLQYTVWNNGAWSPVAEVNDFTTRGRPTVASASATAQVLFHGSDFKYYYTAFSNGVWSAAEPTGSFGPIAGDIAALGNNAVTWFNDGGANNSLTTRSRVNGVWQPSMLLATQVNINISPALITLSGGNSELMGFWPYNAQGPVRFVRRTGGVWGAGADIPGVLTNERVAAVAIPGGNVALVYRGTDGKFHGMIFAAFFNTWQGPFDLPGSPNITGTPAIAPGIGTFEGEAAFISNGQVFHSRFNLETQSFTVPVAVGGAGIGSVALARSN